MRSGFAASLVLLGFGIGCSAGDAGGGGSSASTGGAAGSSGGISGAGGSAPGGSGGAIGNSGGTGNATGSGGVVVGATGGTGNVGGAGGAQPGLGGSPGTGGLVGAWYGTGPDGDECVVVCPNGKVFTGDRPCTDVTAGDFAKYLTASTSGTNITVSGSSQCWLSSSSACGSPSTMAWSVSGDAATVSWCTFVLQLNRTNDPLPVLCDDGARGPC